MLLPSRQHGLAAIHKSKPTGRPIECTDFREPIRIPQSPFVVAAADKPLPIGCKGDIELVRIFEAIDTVNFSSSL